MLSFSHLRLMMTCTLCCMCVANAQAFVLSDPDFQPWIGTASGTRSGNGQPVTLTWSLVADGTSTPNEDGSLTESDLISFLDGTFGGTPAGGNATDFAARPWFNHFTQTFDRWEALSGIDYRYEPNDDGREVSFFSGQLGTRGDIRIGGRNIDGSGSTLAFNYQPNNGDMVLDTREASFFGNASNNFVRFRNTVAHELGHGLGLEHVISSTDSLLLEPSINVSIDGPQLDEVRAAHFFYGDVFEKENNGSGNDTAALATDLGNLLPGGTTSVGTDANVPSQFIGSTATDFVSISNIADTDFFSFTIAEPSQIDAMLTPLGGMFSQSGQGGIPSDFDANARSDLALTIFDTNGVTPLITVDNTGLGVSESLQDFDLLEPGEYFARVTGANDTIQLYQLDLSIDLPFFLEADFNRDTNVDGTDLAIFKTAFGLGTAGDSDDDGDTDGADFLAWQRQFTGAIGTQTSLESVPEPASLALLIFGLATHFSERRARGSRS